MTSINNCSCRALSSPGEFPARWDQSGCAVHGPNAPLYFVDHGMIHCRSTGKHVSLEEAVEIMSVAPDTAGRVMSGIAAELGRMLIAMEKERDQARAECERLKRQIERIDNAWRQDQERMDQALADAERMRRELEEARRGR